MADNGYGTLKNIQDTKPLFLQYLSTTMKEKSCLN